MAAGLRVHVTRPHSGPTRFGRQSAVIVPLHQRDPERLPPPDLERDVPTPLEPDARRAPIIIDPMPPASQFRVMWSFMQLARYVATWLRKKLTGKLDAREHAALTRQLFERLSGIWIKVGQLLSLRSDVISPELAEELGSLQYQARGFPPEVALRVIEEELGRPISAVFSRFEHAPFAAASIAQVHRATLLHNNRAVVVKVMRPDVAKSFARDLKLLETIVLWMGRLRIGRRFRMSEGIAEMRAILTEETNYLYEYVNLKRMRKNLKEHDVYVPRAIKGLCGARVLVIEEIPGVLMSQFLRVRRDDPNRARRWAIMNGIEEKVIARRLSITTFRQILEENEFHGDLHPGNIMLLADSRIALIDFGSVGRLNQHTWMLYRMSLAALAMRDYERAGDLMLMMSPSIAMANNKRLRADMTAALKNWELSAEFPSGTYAERSMAGMSDKIAAVMAYHNVPLSWGIMRVGRSLSTLDASLQTLVPNTNFMTLTRAYFKDRQRRSRTLEGRRAAIGSAMAQVGAVVGDVQLLIGTGLRDQALRLHGMLDRLTQIRIILLTFLQRGLIFLIILVSEAFVFDTFFRDVPEEDHIHLMPVPLVHFIEAALPRMHPLYWLLVIGFMIYMLKMVRSIRHSIARLE